MIRDYENTTTSCFLKNNSWHTLFTQGGNAMSFLYVTENGRVIGHEGGCITVKHKEGTIDKIPEETVEGISIFGMSQVTTQAL